MNVFLEYAILRVHIQDILKFPFGSIKYPNHCPAIEKITYEVPENFSREEGVNLSYPIFKSGFIVFKYLTSTPKKDVLFTVYVKDNDNWFGQLTWDDLLKYMFDREYADFILIYSNNYETEVSIREFRRNQINKYMRQYGFEVVRNEPKESMK